MGVIMQGFYWDCPKLEAKEFKWWTFLQTKLATLSKTGFTALWLPPACKAANMGGMSMGYDPYDYYDLGDIDQKGSKPTWFGTGKELKALITKAHKLKIQVYADLVLNHTNGADEEETNPLNGQKRWTKYNPKSGKFLRDWTCYHPSYFERMDDEAFEGMPDLCHRNPYVYSELMEYARWLVEEIGFDGLRYDFVKGYGTWVITAILERLYSRDGKTHFSPFGVGEYWDSDTSIAAWLRQSNAYSDNPVSAFDFPLRYRLQELCDIPGFSLRTLTQSGTLITDGMAQSAVTFVENHDIIRSSPIVNDKLLAYAFILTHEGYPCVFWQDYYNNGLAQEGKPNGIAALVAAHESYSGGATTILCGDDDNLYMMQRNGFEKQPGLIFVLNTNNKKWNGRTVKTQWANRKLQPIAWWAKDNNDKPEDQQTDDNGNGSFWAPPRGYVVYVPV